MELHGVTAADATIRRQRPAERAPEGVWFRRQLRMVCELPCGTVAQQALNKSGMHRVPGTLRDDAAPDPPACKSKIADEIENLVAHELIVKPQRPVLHALAA